jgi:hypothetical protein
MGKVGVHLENIIVAALHGPFESVDIGSAEPLLTLALNKENCIVKTGLQLFDDFSRAIRRTIINYQHMKVLVQVIDRLEDDPDVFLFVKCWYYNKFLHERLRIFSA